MTNITISYRREDVPAEARRIRDSLGARLGRSTVALAEEAAAAARAEPGLGDVLIALIGPRWLELMRGQAGRGERDEVRSQIASALRRGAAVIPVRVGRAEAMPALPRAEELPEDIRALALGRARTIAVERLETDAIALADSLRAGTGVAAAGQAQAVATAPLATSPRIDMSVASTLHDRAPGNSSIKLALWAGGIIGATVVFANALNWYFVPAARPIASQPGGPIAGQVRPIVQGLTAWTEARIRRAVEAARAKGRRPEEAQRCQSALISATENILFATASAELDQSSYRTLDTLAQIIRGCPDFAVEVEGHTDNAGDPAANQRLSERRAAAVREYLIRSGVDTLSLGSIGYGETRPIAPNDSPANMARNRRIEFNITVR